MTTTFRFLLVDGVDETTITKTDDDFNGCVPMEGDIVMLFDDAWYIDEVRHFPQHDFIPYEIQFVCIRHDDDSEEDYLHLDLDENCY